MSSTPSSSSAQHKESPETSLEKPRQDNPTNDIFHKHGDQNSSSGSPETPSSNADMADIEKAALVDEDEAAKQAKVSSLQRTITPGVASITPPVALPSNATYPEGGLRAWLVVLGSFSGMLAGFGLMNTVGVLQAYISTHQLAEYSPSSIGWLFSVYIFLSFFCGVQIGPIFDAKGPRLLVFLGSVCILTSTFGLANSTEYWHFLLSFSIAGGLGTSLIFTPAVSAIAHFFCVRRGTATGLAATGGSIGGVVFPLMLQRLFESVGWTWAIRTMGFIDIFLICIANLLIRSRLPPKVGGSVWPDFRIFRQLNFAVTTAGVFFMEWGLFIPLTYISSWALEDGVGGQEFAFQLLAILNAASFFGRWIPGYVADVIGRFNAMIVTMALCLTALLIFWAPATSPEGGGKTILAILFAIAFGFASGSNISLTPVCVGQLCEVEEYGRYYATCYTIVSIGCLTGLPIAGELLSRSDGSYGGLIAFTCACYAIGTGCFTFVRIRRSGWSLMSKC